MKLIKIGMKILLFSFVLIIASCKSSQSVTYFNNIKHEYEQSRPIENDIEIRIRANDQLSIKVMSTNAETNNLLNSSLAQSSEGVVTGYSVNKDGYIRFPLIGKVKLSGLTTQEATDKITKYISDNYVKDPIVNVSISNFKITVIGKVGTPRTIVVPGAKINIIEALGYAGDVTDLGDKKNIMIIRELEGLRSTAKIDLTNKEALNSPYFYLQQNDIIYVQPSEDVIKGKGTNPFSIITSVATLVSTITIIILNFTR
ncbi:polysaccharide biosynthesis/export family protein [Larkinella sp. VNQ87]|uniref:polysaccharide biosynthesis/export family protein n=1 Tax=Larkinella sp. VNQ87 TaxID=3400921 RepID=UPI003C0C373F